MPREKQVQKQDGYWRVAIVEDHLLQRRRTEELLAAQSGLAVVHSCESLPEFMTWLAETGRRDRPHLLVLDLVVDRRPPADPLRVKALIDAGLRVLVLSALASPPLVRAMTRAGVGGIVGKRDSEADIVAAVWAVIGRKEWVTPELASVMAGDVDRPSLSEQEERALILYASGLSLGAVATAMGVRSDTAKKYLARVKAKYVAAGRPVRTKVDMHREASKDGLMGVDPALLGWSLDS